MKKPHPYFDDEHHPLLRRAKVLEWTTIGAMGITTLLVGLASGSSQAMRTAFVEDALGLLPPAVFLFAVWRTRRHRDVRYPYGHHRAVAAGHLVAAATLLVLGLLLLISGAMNLIQGSRPPIGTVSLFGNVIWAGWLMIAVMVLAIIPPVVLGPMKLKIAPKLNDFVLYADADMNKADWRSSVATILGVTGIGLGFWWADAVAAMLVSIGIIHDGLSNLRRAVKNLLDARPTEITSRDPNPVIQALWDRAMRCPWVTDAVVRMRDMGHVFHSEVFVLPLPNHHPTVEQVDALSRDLRELDWRTKDTVVVVTREMPEELRRNLSSR